MLISVEKYVKILYNSSLKNNNVLKNIRSVGYIEIGKLLGYKKGCRMGAAFAVKSTYGFQPEPNEDLMDSIFKQYERVIVESLITSFGLDFFINDQHGGDVDTIHNVRKIGTDENMTYKNKSNEVAYEKQERYNANISTEYHSHEKYKSINAENKAKKEAGNLVDAYTGNKVKPNSKTDLDHVISAKEIHSDRGRVLSGLKGTDLANCEENLKATDSSINRSKKEKNVNDFITKLDSSSEERKSELARLKAKDKSQLTEKDKKIIHKYERLEAVDRDEMKKVDANSRKNYEAKIAKEYYTSPKFAKDVTSAAGKLGATMGIKQAVGFIFTEIWFSVKLEFEKIGGKFNFGEFLEAVGNGIKKGFENAKRKYKELFEQFKDGAIAGALSSLTTTLCNIFFTTAKNVTKIIRQTYSALIKAFKILIYNPDNLLFGERVRAATKIIAAGASVVAGGLVSEALNKTPIGNIPVIGEIVQSFCGALVTGILSCTLLYSLDRSEIINKIVTMLNKIPTIESSIQYFKMQGEYLDTYAAELMSIDLEQFKKESEMYSEIASNLSELLTKEELNIELKKAIKLIGAELPWDEEKTSFDDFMSNKNSVLVFK